MKARDIIERLTAPAPVAPPKPGVKPKPSTPAPEPPPRPRRHPNPFRRREIEPGEKSKPKARRGSKARSLFT